MKRNRVLLIFLAIVAVIAVSGCTHKEDLGPLKGLSEKTPTPVVAVIPTPTAAMPTEAPTVAPPTAESTATQAAPGQASTPEQPTKQSCSPQAAFVMDITVPDGAEFAPGEGFHKVWRMMNTGDCAWPDGTVLAFVSGEKLGAPGQVPVEIPSPGKTVDIGVDMVAPQTPGTYKSTWRLVAPGGIPFGPVVYVNIVVKAPAPTATPQPTNTPVPSPTPACASAPDPMFDPILNKAALAGMSLGCPQDGVVQMQGAFQGFWSNVEDPNPHMHLPGIMIWTKDTRKIYVMSRYSETQRYGDFQVYDDLWHEGLPEVPPACAGLTPPPGYQLPIRGFGKVWCDHGLKDVIGWPDQKEIAVTLQIQGMDNGVLIKTSNGYWIALELSSHHWTFER